MAVRCSRFFVVSRLITQSARTFSLKPSVSTEIGSSTSLLSKDRATGKPTIAKNDPDVFGTLRPEKLLGVESLFKNDRDQDKGDVEEEKFLSFQPVNRKSVTQYEDKVNELIKNNQLKEAFKVLETEMKEERVKPSRNIYSLLLGACGKAGYTKKAFMLFNDMKKRGMMPSESHYTALFNACANSPWHEDGLARAKKLRQQLADKNYLLNKLQYHAMLKAFGRCGDVNTAFQILDEMTSKQISITTETLNFLLQACISLPQDGFKYAIMVWRKLRLAKVTPDVYSYNLMLRCARDCGISDVQSFYQDCLPFLQSNDNRTLSIASKQKFSEKSLPGKSDLTVIISEPHSIVTSQCEAELSLPNFLAEKVRSSSLVEIQNLNRPEDRLALLGGFNGFLSEMRNDHAKPDIKTWSLLLETISSTHQDEMILLGKMEEVGVVPDADFVNLLIKKRQLRRDYRTAKDGLELLQKYNLFPNIMTFGVLALGVRNIDQCVSFCAMLEDAGLRMNKEIYGSLLKNAVHRKDCWYVMHLTNYAKKNELTLDERAIKLISDFRVKSTEEIAKSDRGEKVNPVYDNPKFRKSFGEFCKSFKETLKQLSVQLDPHPWAQYRYEQNISDQDSKP